MSTICIIYEKTHEERVKLCVKNIKIAEKIVNCLNHENLTSEFYFVEYPIIDENEEV